MYFILFFFLILFYFFFDFIIILVLEFLYKKSTDFNLFFKLPILNGIRHNILTFQVMVTINIMDINDFNLEKLIKMSLK